MEVRDLHDTYVAHAFEDGAERPRLNRMRSDPLCRCEDLARDGFLPDCAGSMHGAAWLANARWCRVFMDAPESHASGPRLRWTR